MLHSQWVGHSTALFVCALFHVIYDRDNLRFGAGSIADSGGWLVSPQPWQGVKTWALLPAGDWILLWLLHEKQGPIKPFPEISPLVIS